MEDLVIEKMGKYSIEIKVQFRAGHRLIAPYKGNCNNLHGEGYTAVLFFTANSELDNCGMVIDFKTIKRYVKTWIDEYLDHSYLCHREDSLGEDLIEQGFKVYRMKSNPTAENIAKLIFDSIKIQYPSLYKVGIWESFDDSIAWYEE